MLTFNEGKVCDAIICHLEAREGAPRADLRSPEKERHGAPVELVCRIGQKLFAFEHTGIEPFEGHMQMEAEAKRHIEPIRAALAGALPSTEVFELHIPAKAFQGRKKPEISQIQDAIVLWVRQRAPTLPIRRYADYIGDINPIAPPGVPFCVTLYRFESVRQPGFFSIVHIVTGDREQARTDRFRAACDKKFPKLNSWKQTEGARTILILEDNDIQLTNQAIVAETYLPLAKARTDRPDETYVVVTCMEPWRAWPILVGDVSYFDLAGRADEVGWEIDQAALSGLTGR
jgi:hypothetical protein